MPENGVQNVVRPAERSEMTNPPRGVFLRRRMRGVRVALVVEIVNEPSQAPSRGILAELCGVSPHCGLDGQHVLSERIALSEFVDDSERVGAGGEHHRNMWPPDTTRAPAEGRV